MYIIILQLSTKVYHTDDHSKELRELTHLFGGSVSATQGWYITTQSVITTQKLEVV